MKERLAIEGGPKAVKTKPPGIFPGGNDIGEEELSLDGLILARPLLEIIQGVQMRSTVIVSLGEP